MDDNNKPHTGKRIGVFGKGGAGKSTFSILLARVLSDSGYGVCLVDADSTNYGLTQALGITKPIKPLLHYFGGMVFQGGDVTCPVDDPRPLIGADLDLEDLNPCYYGTNQDGVILLIAGKIGDQGPGAGCDGPIAKIARDIRISVADEQLITILDFKAGFEDSARGVITSLDYVIVVIDPTIASIELANEMKQMVSRINAGELPATAHLANQDLINFANQVFMEANIQTVWFVLNRVQNADIEDIMRQRLADKDIFPAAAIRENSTISQSWLRGTALESDSGMQEVRTIGRLLEEEFKQAQTVS